MITVKHLPKVALACAVALAFSGGIAVAGGSGQGQGQGGRVVRPALSAPHVVTQTGFVPVAPCRIASTVHAGGRIPGLHSRTFAVTGTTGFSGQGGTAGGCGIPAGAAAVAVSVTAVHEAHYGYLTLYAADKPRPGVDQLSYGADTGLTTTVDVPLNPVTGRLAVYTASTSDVTLDVAGYYREPIAAYVNYDGSVAAKSGQISAITRTSMGHYQVDFNQNIQGCAVSATNEISYDNIGVSPGTSTRVYVYTTVANAASSTYADTAFSLTVTC